MLAPREGQDSLLPRDSSLDPGTALSPGFPPPARVVPRRDSTRHGTDAGHEGGR